MEWSISLLRHFKIQTLLKINCCMAAISAFRVTQHSQIFSLFFRNRIQCIALYQLYNSQARFNLRRGYYRDAIERTHRIGPLITDVDDFGTLYNVCAVPWGCSVPWGDIMSTVRDILITVGGVQYHGGILSTVGVFSTVGVS